MHNQCYTIGNNKKGDAAKNNGYTYSELIYGKVYKTEYRGSIDTT